MNILEETVVAAKRAAAYKAADFIENDMLVGLGTGSTAAYFIERLGFRLKEGLKILAVASSSRSAEQASAEGISLIDIEQLSSLDIVIDGADEIDLLKNMIKGGGGALVRERIVASMSREMVVVVDERKVVRKLGGFPVPVEIIPFGYNACIRKLFSLGYLGKLRMASGKPYVTDNHNYIVDITFSEPIERPEEHRSVIRSLPGVVDTGFFIGMAGRVVVGHYDGSVEILD